ncbi:MAG: tyrosine-protein phosphatase, partial [Planctomycetes bacterium]|nr:tyrosine-protein phosphatase [Planctomycetota bacterium]
MGLADRASSEAAGTSAASGDAQPQAKIDEAAYPHLHNLIQVSETIYSGGQPTGEEEFAELARLGVKTVVSVDGARPDLEAAEKHGLRYVHIPIGYDGVPEEAGQSFAQLMRTAEGPFFFHCHHGKHRGPAGAAVACIAAGQRDAKEALEILELAGTSKDYPGLWRDVEDYTPPPAGAELPELAPVAEVGSMAAAMAHIDRHNDNLKLLAANKWRPLAGH